MVGFKFERLEIWQLSLEYLDLCYVVAERLPKQEEYNLKTQITRAATSIALNIAEGSTSQNDAEQARFLGLSLRSLVETVACRRLIQHRGYLTGDEELMTGVDEIGQKLFTKLQAMRRTLTDGKASRLADGGQPSPVGRQHSSVHGPRSTVTNRNSAVNRPRSSVNNRPSLVLGQRSLVD